MCWPWPENAENVNIQSSNKITIFGDRKREKNYCKTNQSFYLFMSLRVGWWVCMLCKYIQFLVDRAQVVLGKSLALIVLALKMCVLNFGKTKSHSFSTMKT